MTTEAPNAWHRAWLPLTGVLLSLVALLLIPIVIGRQTRDLRDRMLREDVPVLMTVEAFRVAAADEVAATRLLVATNDPAAVEWVERSANERRALLERLGEIEPLLQPGTAVRLHALLDAAAELPAPSEIARPVSAATDTSALWAAWSGVTRAGEVFRRGIEAEITTADLEIRRMERTGFILTTLLAFLAFASAMVTARMEQRSRAFALESERARREQQVLLESSGEGVFGVDARGFCTFLNPAGAKLIGYADEEVLGNELRALLAPNQAAGAAPSGEYLRTRGFAGGPIGQLEETTLRQEDGTPIEVEVLTSPILEAGSVRGAVITLRDIAQRKAVERDRLALLRREQALRENAEAAERRAKFLARASELFGTSLDIDTTLNSLSNLLVPGVADSLVVYLMDESGEIERLQPVHVDPERQRILANQLNRYPPRLESLIRPVRAALLEGKPSLIRTVSSASLKAFPGDETHQSVVSSIGLKSLVVVPLRARGRIIGAISYGVADSGREYGPDDLALAEDLGSRAALALDNARLYQQSQAAVRARNEVLGIVSHDLRNPLNAVRFGAQALLRHWPPIADGEVERNQIGAITKAADRMHRLIRDLLDVAQIDVGRLAVEPVPVPASILVEDAIELATPAAADRSVAVESRSAPDLPVLMADGERILQVFSNLLNNAVKFSPPGSRITVGAERVDGEVLFSVADQGRGIDPDQIPHVFDRFWRSGNGSREGGAGLGLAIAKGIVESHGGRIWVRSTVGAGSTFYFSLPEARADDAYHPLPEARAS